MLSVNFHYLFGVTFYMTKEPGTYVSLLYTHLKKLYCTLLMMDYDKIVKALTANFVSVESLKIIQPCTVDNFCDFENLLILNHSGEISYLQGGVREWVEPGEAVFIPSKKLVTITYGPVTYAHSGSSSIPHDYFLGHRWKYLQAAPLAADQPSLGSFSCLSFEARVLEVINLFASSLVPVFGIRDNKRLITLFNNIVAESTSPVVGSGFVLTNCTALLVIELLRYMYNNQLLPKQLEMYHPYREDTHFLNTLNYIHKNLDKDLSYKKILKVAKISQEYLRHYFRSRVGVKPREYVEARRLEKAVRLLRTTQKRIDEIAPEVGFAGIHYFCRSFKLRMGIPASKIRGGMR
ncbi:MAG: AraC family transcriptional regulator [Bacteroidota bacterium]